MRKYLNFFTIIIILMGCIYCTKTDDYPKEVSIWIEGTPGLRFSGTFGNSTGDTTVIGFIPTNYLTELTNDDDYVSGSFSKVYELGFLILRVYVDSSLVVEHLIDEPYGTTEFSYPN